MSSRTAPTAYAALMRDTVRDLFVHRQWIYWVDMLVTAAVAYPAASGFIESPILSWQKPVLFVIAAIGLFRLGSFIHEIVHMRQGEMVAFRVVWNVLAIPMLMPSHFYANHLDHHGAHYGTSQDGEYLPVGQSLWRHLWNHFFQATIMPAWVGIRFLFIAPLTFLHPGVGRWAQKYWSSFVINFDYTRTHCKPLHWSQHALEFLCCVRAWLIFVFIFLGVHPWYNIFQLYLLGMCTLGMNGVRNLVAHRYLSAGEHLSHDSQLRDSINVVGGWFTELFFPVGLRFHALHHQFPALPYYNLGIAHRRLMATLPPDADYRQTVFKNFWTALASVTAEGRSDLAAERRTEWYARHTERPLAPQPD